MTTRSRDIESTANDRVKTWLALSRRSVRDETGQFLIEGRRETIRALEHLTVDELIWCPDIHSTPLQADIVTTTVSRRVFEKISRRQNPDGIAAVTSTPDLSLACFAPSAPTLVLVADGVEKPGNIGAMFRTCNAFGAAFLGSSLGTDLVNPNVIRSAQGSLFSVPSASVARKKAIDWCRANTEILVAHLDGDTTLWDSDLTGPTTIVVGAEHEGVDPEWLDVGTTVIIPMTGSADSLNVSVSAGVFLSEASRQRS